MNDDPVPDLSDSLLEVQSPTPISNPIPGPISSPISSEELLGGQREIIIQHGTEQYRLRLTNNNKLILVK
jgi:hemin uptake protein HemP